MGALFSKEFIGWKLKYIQPFHLKILIRHRLDLSARHSGLKWEKLCNILRKHFLFFFLYTTGSLGATYLGISRKNIKKCWSYHLVPLPKIVLFFSDFIPLFIRSVSLIWILEILQILFNKVRYENEEFH